MTILTKQPLSLLHFDNEWVDAKGNTWYKRDTNALPTSTLSQFKFNKSMQFNYFNQTRTAMMCSDFIVDTTKDFSISYYEYKLLAIDNATPFKLNYNEANSNQTALGLYDNGTNLYLNCADQNGNALINFYNLTPTSNLLNKWVHWEFCYKSATKSLYAFKDGILINTWMLSSNPFKGGHMILGWIFDGYIDELLVTQECLHTTNFTPPTSAYEFALHYWLAKTKANPSYWSYKTNSWVDVGLPTTDADIATLFVNQGTDTCPTQQQLELLGTGVNRPNRCCYQTLVTTQPTININAIPTGKTVKPEELLPISSIEGIDSVSVANTISTGINDETGKIWTKVGSPTISNTQSKFGGSSLYLDGSSYLSTPITSDLNLSTGDFTIEWWEYRTNASLNLTALTFDTGTSDVYDFILGYSNGTNVVAYASSNNSSWDILNGLSLGSISLNQWSHYTLVRSGNVFTTYKNGTMVATATSSLPIKFDILTKLLIGNRLSTVNGIYAGYIDELRISNTARYTTNFTPQTAPHTKDAGTLSLLHFDSSAVKLKLAVTLDLVTYYKFNGSAWEVIDINTNQDNMMDIATVASINRSQWDLLTNGTASGIAFAYYLDISGMGDTVKIDKTSLVVDMKGGWDSAIKGTDFRYGYPANDRLKVTLLTTGNYKINYVGG